MKTDITTTYDHFAVASSHISPLRMTIANTIKNARKAKGCKQAALAKKIGCTQATLSRIESGVTGVELDLLFKLCTQLDISIEKLLEALR